ncbi:hypothetical protein Mapa_006656 [Marchantia paleacea]|nr:hypothetical protein Mapa_006656 [Marchantia paleacea]
MGSEDSDYSDNTALIGVIIIACAAFLVITLSIARYFSKKEEDGGADAGSLCDGLALAILCGGEGDGDDGGSGGD